MDKANQLNQAVTQPIDFEPLSWWANAAVGLTVSSAFASTFFILAFAIHTDISHPTASIAAFFIAFFGLWLGSTMLRKILKNGILNVIAASTSADIDNVDDIKKTLGNVF